MVCPQYWVCGLTHHGLPTVLGLWSHTPWFAHSLGSVVSHTMVCPQYWVCGLVTHTMVCPQYWVCGLTHHGLPTILGLWSHTPWFAHSIGCVVSHTMVCPQYWVCGLTHHGLPTILGLWSGDTHHGLPTILGLWSHTPWFAHNIGSVVSHTSFPLTTLLSPIIHT